MALIGLVAAAVLEVAGDYAIRKGMPSGWMTMAVGAVLLAAYGFAVNFWWGGGFSKLLGLYVVFFFVVSQVWGMAFEGEALDIPRVIGGTLIIGGGMVIQFWPSA